MRIETLKIVSPIFIWVLAVLFGSLDVGFAVSTEVGQIFMVGFNEAEPTSDLIQHLKKIKPGAIILFRRNIQSPQQLENLVNTLRKELNPILDSPLLFAIDQEGGSVYRIPTSPRIPSPAALGKSNDPKIVEEYGFAIGNVLKKNGISMNLAPVLDLDLAKDKNFIGSRSFGTNPAQVAQLGFLFAKGLAAAGVIPTGKHFPGLGAVAADPHEVTPTSDLTWQEGWNRELLPFREFSRLTPSALMLSHVVYPQLDSQRLPASISPYIIKRVLRESLKYHGLVITDDLLMKGITSKLNPSEAALASLKSGADLIMLSWSRQDQMKVYADLKKALQERRLDESELNEKQGRIQQIKKLIRLDETAKTTAGGWVSEGIRRLNRQLLMANLQQDLPTYKKIKNKKNFYFVNLNSTWPKTFAQRFKEADTITLSSISEFQKLNSIQKKDSLLILGVHQPASFASLQNLSAQEKSQTILVVVNDFQIEKPESYYSVFSPLWTFDGIASAVIKFL